jgi:Protein of unknown function DUF262
MANAEVEASEDVDDFDETNETVPASFTITSYGADYPVDGLVKRIRQGDIVIPIFDAEPAEGQSAVGFQREFVWRKPQADRFVESLLLGLPVPGIFLVKEANGKHLVLDGHQRLKTLEGFYRELFQGEEFKLVNVQDQWKGKSYTTLASDDRRRLDDSIIHATIVRQDEPSEDLSSIYLIFERLNSGGTLLQPQEIRVALYHGQFATLLSKLNHNAAWRALYGKRSPRLKDIELILRFFALYYRAAQYSRPMKEPLNKFMAYNKNLGKYPEADLVSIFERTVSQILEHIGPSAFRPQRSVNAAVLDSVMVGVADRVSSGQAIADGGGLKAAYQVLMANPQYQRYTTRATADEESVRERLTLAKQAFSTLQ